MNGRRVPIAREVRARGVELWLQNGRQQEEMCVRETGL